MRCNKVCSCSYSVLFLNVTAALLFFVWYEEGTLKWKNRWKIPCSMCVKNGSVIVGGGGGNNDFVICRFVCLFVCFLLLLLTVVVCVAFDDDFVVGFLG